MIENFLLAATPSTGVYDKFGSWLKMSDLTKGTLNGLGGWLIQQLYNATSNLEDAFNFVINFLGFTTYSGLGNIQKVFTVFGWALLALALMMGAFEMIIGKRLAFHNIMTNIVVIVSICTVLPQIIGYLNTFAQEGSQAVTEGATDKNTASSNSLALQVIQNNVVDLGVIAKNGFAKTPNDILQKNQKANSITQNNIQNVDFSQIIEASNSSDKTGNVTADYSKYSASKWGKGVTSQDVLTDGTVTDQDGKDHVVQLAKNHLLVKALNTGYLRYHFSLIPILVQSVVLILLFVLGAVKIIKIIFELAIIKVIAVLTSFSSAKSTTRAKEVIKSLFGGYMAIVLQITTIQMFLIFIKYAESKTGGSSLNMGGKMVVDIIAYIGAFYGAMSGSGFIEKMTGMSAGYGGEASQVMGTTVGAGLLGGAVGGAIGGTAVNSLKTNGGLIKSGIENVSSSFGGGSGDGTGSATSNLSMLNAGSPISETTSSKDQQSSQSSSNNSNPTSSKGGDQSNNQNSQENSADQSAESNNTTQEDGENPNVDNDEGTGVTEEQDTGEQSTGEQGTEEQSTNSGENMSNSIDSGNEAPIETEMGSQNSNDNSSDGKNENSSVDGTDGSIKTDNNGSESGTENSNDDKYNSGERGINDNETNLGTENAGLASEQSNNANTGENANTDTSDTPESDTGSKFNTDNNSNTDETSDVFNENNLADNSSNENHNHISKGDNNSKVGQRSATDVLQEFNQNLQQQNSEQVYKGTSVDDSSDDYI